MKVIKRTFHMRLFLYGVAMNPEVKETLPLKLLH